MKITSQKLAETFRRSNCFAGAIALCSPGMSEQNENPRHYQWPWFVLAAVVLFVTLAVVFVGLKARQIKQERDFDAPLPGGAQR
jgi:heme/copper-type cytochrome/quinol oxidase subunit 2